MIDVGYHLKSYLEGTFSMPFEVRTVTKDNEIHYLCFPQNEDEMYFNVEIYIKNNIRLVVDITPQKHGRYILDDMSIAIKEKQTRFFLYIEMLRNLGAKLDFSVNGSALNDKDGWPSSWRMFRCKIYLLPIPDTDEVSDKVKVLSKWLEYSFELIFSLLTVSDVADKVESVQTEGRPYEVKSIRYERNSINRKLCVHRKGYNCAVCGMNFFDTYGDIGYHFIEVHHLKPVSLMDPEYIFDVDRDLVPLCSNCHSMIHKRNPPFTIEELKECLAYRKSNPKTK